MCLTTITICANAIFKITLWDWTPSKIAFWCNVMILHVVFFTDISLTLDLFPLSMDLFSHDHRVSESSNHFPPSHSDLIYLITLINIPHTFVGWGVILFFHRVTKSHALIGCHGHQACIFQINLFSIYNTNNVYWLDAVMTVKCGVRHSFQSHHLLHRHLLRVNKFRCLTTLPGALTCYFLSLVPWRISSRVTAILCFIVSTLLHHYKHRC